MNLQELNKIAEVIYNNYQNQMRNMDTKAFYENLKLFLADEPYQKVSKNLFNHIKESSYLPSIKDLVKDDRDVLRGVPTAEETEAYIQSMEEHKKNALPKEVVDSYLQKIKSIIGGLE